MKLIVQIPCFNEEKTLSRTIRDIPRKIEGIDAVEILIIDDGSTDRTVAVAKESGAEHIVQNICNKGLARTFHAGLDASLRLGADIIVNTDGDNQYQGKDIPKLIRPILSGEADIVVADRQTATIPHFSATKKQLQKLGSFMVRFLSETNIIDAVSGFRAFSREAAMQMNIVSPYSYTIETVIQAGKKHLAITNVQVGTNPPARRSRLLKNLPRYIERSVSTMIRMYTMYQPLRTFFYIGCILIICGFIPSIRFLIYYLEGYGGGHIQSLILAAVLFVVGFQALMIGLVADVVSFNRRILEETLLRVRRIELDHLNPNKKK